MNEVLKTVKNYFKKIKIEWIIKSGLYAKQLNKNKYNY